jgi:hypothetical protein
MDETRPRKDSAARVTRIRHRSHGDRTSQSAGNLNRLNSEQPLEHGRRCPLTSIVHNAIIQTSVIKAMFKKYCDRCFSGQMASLTMTKNGGTCLDNAKCKMNRRQRASIRH